MTGPAAAAVNCSTVDEVDTDYRVGADSDAIKVGLTEVSVGLALPAIGHEPASSRLDGRFRLRATAFAATKPAANGTHTR